MHDRKAISVPAETAEAYERASEAGRRRAERAMTFALLPRKEAAAAFDEITTRMSDYARRKGLTKDKLEALLEEEGDAE